jgi:integrase
MNTAHAIKDTNQIKELLDVYPKESKNRLLIEYALRTGLRISDILSVRVSDVLGRDTYIIKEQKTGKTKELALHDALKLSIFNYVSKHELEADDYLFYSNANKNTPIQRMQAHRIIAKAGDMIGVTLSAHSLRKTFGYQAYKQGVDISLLQSIFQHSSQAVTLRYIDITQENINDVYKKINLGF